MFWSPLVLSVEVATAATVLCTLFGVAFGLLLARPHTPWRNALDVLLTMPMVMPPTVLGYFILVAVGHGSAIGTAWEHLTGTPLVFTRAGVILAASIGSLPLVVRSARTAFEDIDTSLVDVARTLGADPFRTFWTIRLPLAAHGIVAGMVLAFARALGDFGLTLMVGGNIPGQTQTASMAIYDALQARRMSDVGGMITVLCVVAFAALYTVHRLRPGADVR